MRQGMRTIVVFFFCCFIALVHGDANFSTQHNIAFPQLPAPSTLPVVILDAGHGGDDQGAKVHSFLEKRITLSTVLFTKKYLEELGYKVILTRTRDIFVSLPRRVIIANRTKGVLFSVFTSMPPSQKQQKG